MRYQREKSPDWAEISGAAERELQELDAMWGTATQPIQELVTAVVTDCAFTNRKGENVDPRENYRRLTFKQWQWLRDRIVDASLNEVLDPEA